MPYIHQNNHFTAFVIPNDADVHVDAALKKILGSLNAFGAQRGMGRIFSQEFQLGFKLIFFLCGQAFKMLLKTGGKGKLICHQSASNLSNKASTLSKTGCFPDAIFSFISLISSRSSCRYFLG